MHLGVFLDWVRWINSLIKILGIYLYTWPVISLITFLQAYLISHTPTTLTLEQESTFIFLVSVPLSQIQDQCCLMDEFIILDTGKDCRRPTDCIQMRTLPSPSHRYLHTACEWMFHHSIWYLMSFLIVRIRWTCQVGCHLWRIRVCALSLLRHWWFMIGCPIVMWMGMVMEHTARTHFFLYQKYLMNVIQRYRRRWPVRSCKNSQLDCS